MALKREKKKIEREKKGEKGVAARNNGGKCNKKKEKT